MFVVEVWMLLVPSASSASAGSPDRGSVSATIEAHVRAAYSRNWAASPPAASADPAIANDIDTNTTINATMRWIPMVGSSRSTQPPAPYPPRRTANHSGFDISRAGDRAARDGRVATKFRREEPWVARAEGPSLSPA
jgi:hypothetical protein